MGLFDNYGFNPNVITTTTVPYSPQWRTMVPNPPTSITSQQTRDLEKVNGIDSARQYPMPANSRVALFDINDDVFYVKETIYSRGSFDGLPLAFLL